MGMNHALADAAALDELLHAHGGELALALPAYSAERVKEGQALTDVADFVQCYDSSAQPMPHTSGHRGQPPSEPPGPAPTPVAWAATLRLAQRPTAARGRPRCPSRGLF